MSLADQAATDVAIRTRSGEPDDDAGSDDACAPGTSGRLDLPAKLFQRSIWQRASAVAQGQPVRAPLVVELDPTSFCDMACPECISIDLLNQTRFDRRRLVALAGELVDAGVQAVILIGGGEPLLHSAVGEVIEVLGSAGVAIGLTTNGTMIHRHLDVISQHVHWTRVSVDAGTPECFERFRPHRSHRNMFGTVIDNMAALAAHKTGSLGYSFLLIARRDHQGRVVDSNFNDVAAAAGLADEIGCDYFEVKPMYDMAHFLIEQPAALTELLADQLAQASTLASENFSVISPRTLTTVITDRQLIEPKPYHQCPVVELRTLVTSAGAYLCPYHRGNPLARYGDPLTETFADMWTGKRRHEVKSGIDPATDCQFHCIRHDTNMTLLRMAHKDLSNEVGPDYDPFI